jgi:hypothetical protein
MNLRRNYANLTEVSNEFSRRIGNVLGEDGQPRMGASLLKSAVQSNSDRNSKALFSLVKQITGNDHYRGALNAQIAMQAVGDPRINDLLKSVGAIKDIMSLNKEGILTKGAEGVLNAVRGNKLKQTLDYYNKYHTPNIKTPTSPFSLLGNESGAVGSIGTAQEQMGLTPAIKDPTTGEIYEGDWRGHKGALNKAPDEITRNSLWGELFKDNAGKPTDYVGFINKEGKFMSRAEAEARISNTMGGGFHDFTESELGSTALKMLGLTAGISGAALGTGLTLEEIVRQLQNKGK